MMRRVLVVLLLSACGARPQAFDWARVQPGDSVGVWRVVQRDVRPDPGERGWIGDVRYAGEAEVSGMFQAHPDSELHALCFFVDESDRGILPRFPNDVRKPWFCFTNEDGVRPVASEGMHARIRIADYRYLYSHTDVYNTARFVALAR
jgi:hypothetical protein